MSKRKVLMLLGYVVFIAIMMYSVITGDNYVYGVVSYFNGNVVMVEMAHDGVIRDFYDFPQGLCVGDTVTIDLDGMRIITK